MELHGFTVIFKSKPDNVSTEISFCASDEYEAEEIAYGRLKSNSLVWKIPPNGTIEIDSIIKDY